MMKEFELFGEWFLPINQDKREVGTLIYHPFEGITLKLHGNFSDDLGMPSDDDVDIICGVTSDGKQITLLNCSVTSRGCNTSIMGEKAVVQSTVTYTALYLLIGSHIDNKDNMMFSKISAEIFNLREWMNKRGFQEKDEYDPNDKSRVIEHTVSCKLPEIIEFEITEGIIGKFVPMMGGKSSRYQTTITQKLLFQIQSTQKQTIGDLLGYIGTLADLIDLALYRRTHFLSIILDGNRLSHGIRPSNRLIIKYPICQKRLFV